jgi:tRNA pseudouridine32 synthase/23S rRNA pseudouridine746 synthase/23S rRNA pseudouridine1911/1915/1917 synthase
MKIVKPPKRYQPLGFEILHEDHDLIIGNKVAGFLTVSALWEKKNTIHSALNNYIRKGNPNSKKCVFVVHRLDQATSGVLVFAKSKEAQCTLKDNWSSTVKTYYAIVHGKMTKKSGTITSYLAEDEDYVMHTTLDTKNGKLAQTEYNVVKETQHFSVLKVNLKTGKKNQIRVHLAEEGHPIVGDTKYGKDKTSKYKNLMLHSFSFVFMHPFSNEKMRIQADVPDYFKSVVNYSY